MKMDEIRYIGLQETLACLGNDLIKCQNRSLFYNRFVDPRCKKEDRESIYNQFIRKSADLSKANIWNLWVHEVSKKTPLSELIYAQQKSRMMINMSGGVMENAGLCLDRFGIPYIPGSAVKGCARRMAIQELYELRTSRAKTDEEVAEMLVKIAIIFGWGEQDWNGGKKNGVFISDFTYAIGDERWENVSNLAAKKLVSLGILKKEPKNFKEFGAYAGTVSFMPAYPLHFDSLQLEPSSFSANLSKVAEIELDVVTCHHTEYYNGEKPVATDDEEPNPVKFPAVAAGSVFVFPIFPLKNCSKEAVQSAKKWLSEGLKNFGIGAKTAAGYGWFEDVTEQFNKKVSEVFQAQLQEYKKKIVEIENAKNLKPEDKLKNEYLKLNDEQFAAKAKEHSKMNDEEKKAFLTALKEKKETVKRWKKKKPELINPWIEYGKKLNPPVEL
ncbi:MAG: type III-B CRISPR module RAMP protein Cmr6 [Verrucomicrobiia bacterium]